MDELNDFMNCSSNFKRKAVSGGYINGRIVGDPEMFQTPSKRESIGTEYSIDFKLEENRKMLEAHNTKNQTVGSYVTSLNDLDNDNIMVIDEEKTELVYQKFNFTNVNGNSLPIMEKKNHILAAIQDNSAIIIQGSTGCGKTTQVPQFILDHSKNKNEYCNIVITQPRRIAAISIAKRVCHERKWPLGTLVGYQVGLHAESNDDTRLLYCTTGVLLQKIIHTKSLCGYTHIILDEVHERDVEMDFLLIVLRRYMTCDSPNVKIILMSATIEAEKFAEYFTFPRMNALVPAPILNIERENLYKVNEFYLCSLKKLMNNELPEINYDDPGICDEVYEVATKLVEICDRLDDLESNFSRPKILMFLPGIYEIESMHQKLQTLPIAHQLQIIILHSSMTVDDQNNIFRNSNQNCRIVILSTNIAESSVTVPDVKYVFDFCLTKILVTDSNTGFTSLKLDWAAKNNCMQRSGRTGRVMNGRVYRLVTRNFYERYMQNFSKPEMLRCPLENIVLKAKILDVGQPHAILALAMNPPNLSDIANTILVLKEVGALLKTTNGQYLKFDGDLTFIGRIMSALPLSIRVSRLIVFGFMFSLLEETIIIGAGLSVRNVFLSDFNNPIKAYSKKLRWSDGSGSDLIALLNVYKTFIKKSEQNLLQDEVSTSFWHLQFLVQLKALKEMDVLVKEVKNRLKNIGIREMEGINRVNWSDKEKQIIIKIIIAGAFYPYYFVKSSIEEEDAFRALGGRDPCSTVYFSGFESKYIRCLYQKPIKDILSKCTDNLNNVKLSFEENSEKVYVSFTNTKPPFELTSNSLQIVMPGRILTEVYNAIKLRKKLPRHELNVLSIVEASKYVEQIGLGSVTNGVWQQPKKHSKRFKTILPTALISSLFGEVTYFDNCDKFWFRPESSQDEFIKLEASIHDENLDSLRFVDTSEITIGLMVLAPFKQKESLKYFRGKIREYKGKNENNVLIFTVEFIDYGNLTDVNFSDLRKIFSENLKDNPPLVFECVLAEVQPSILMSQRGSWTVEALQLFEEFVSAKRLEIEIYSVVNGVVSVFLKSNNRQINSLLIANGYGTFLEENYLSKINHELRVRKQKFMINNKNNIMDTDYNENYIQEDLPVIEPPPKDQCNRHITLKGPFSPLESTLSSYANNANFKAISVEQSSVNSVLLNTDPQDPHEKVLVAAAVSETKNGSELIARSTTIMPNIKGFGVLMALIFSPTMEIGRNVSKTQYISILCGLGYDPNTNIPLFPEHDMLFNLDVEISTDDFKKINHIRSLMDTLLFTLPGEDKPRIEDKEKVQVTNKIKKLIIELLEKERHSIAKQYVCNGYKWGDFDQDNAIHMPSIHEERAVFPLHCILTLESKSGDEIKKLQKNCMELHNLKNLDIPIQPTLCKLCGKSLDSIQKIRIHLLCRLHRDREEDIKFVLPNDECPKHD